MFEDVRMSSLSQVPVDQPDRNQPAPYPLDAPEAFGYRAHLLSTSALVFTQQRNANVDLSLMPVKRRCGAGCKKGEMSEPIRIGGKCFWHAERHRGARSATSANAYRYRSGVLGP